MPCRVCEKQANDSSASSVGDWRIAVAVRFIQSRFFDPCLSLSSIAAHVGISESRICQLFHRELGMGVKRYIIDHRLRRARELLRNTHMPVKRVMLAVRVGKSQRSDVLPLPSITGQAIAEYLRKARPATESRAVFVRHQARLHLPVNASVIRSVVRQAAARSGLTNRLHGPHRLRHSAATRMLHGGATLKEIADILRHRSLDTTAIYAKVDVPRRVARVTTKRIDGGPYKPRCWACARAVLGRANTNI